MDNPLISIVIPVYNVEQYLDECLESVINQTYKNIEIIAVNDGSTDRSLHILKEYAKKYRNIKVLNQENRGNSIARNRGIEQAKGKYINFLDSDDYLALDTIENLVNQMEKHNLDIIRFGAEPFVDGVDYDISHNQYDFKSYYEKGKVYDKEEFLASLQKTLLQKAFSASPCLFIVKREIIIKNQIQFTPGIRYEDELFTLEVFLNVNKAMYDPNLYYKRRYRANSIMTSQKDAENFQNSFNSYSYVIHELGKLMEKYNHPMEKKLIRKRIRKLYGITMNIKNIDKEEKRKLSQINSINAWDKFCFNAMYKAKNVISK
jgi:glycosyltransferase involved in cell wall biosynthesis